MRLLSVFRCATVLPLLVAAAAQAAGPKVNDLSIAFDEFYGRTEFMSLPARVDEFRRSVGARFPQFYGDERIQFSHAEQDERIGAAIVRYPAMRDGYLRKARTFGAQLSGYVTAFQARFPDYRYDGEIWLLHSLGEMDGGTRTLAGKAYLIFGADGLARFHAGGDDGAFFHHELFHTYHEPALAACADSVVWKSLWTEGLAVYTSQQMHPEANDKELLTDFPAGTVAKTKAVLPAAWAQLDKVLDSTDPQVNASLFQLSSRDKSLPQRRGYYLGYLVAQEAAKTRDVAELAKLGCGPARELVTATVRKLKVATGR
ncbi:hypothetical protein [Pseudoduganella armeniaca]|uniref:DUF2268 domain-containing protein n=1 Tax=Pseudoduganella armeniaca TaxID=2072590 RepID=A0A2R4C4U1_9BURK|nr:hypothetical protein [Pseudoduganella armeniaca]AVR94624.1 hypothetical protein C9I28_02010 [Pseudoduganella armeniaca]